MSAHLLDSILPPTIFSFFPEGFAILEELAQTEEDETCQGVNIPGLSLSIVGG